MRYCNVFRRRSLCVVRGDAGESLRETPLSTNCSKASKLVDLYHGGQCRPGVGIYEALLEIDRSGAHDVIVNVQGDVPTIAPDVIRASLAPLDTPETDIGTLACPITDTHERDDPAVVKYYTDRIPLHRAGQPEEMAGTIAYLLSDDASYVTCATVLVRVAKGV